MSVAIEPATAARFGPTEPNVVRATFDDGTTRELFEFYSDELHFEASEFVGMTEIHARELHHRRDVRWLHS